MFNCCFHDLAHPDAAFGYGIDLEVMNCWLRELYSSGETGFGWDQLEVEDAHGLLFHRG